MNPIHSILVIVDPTADEHPAIAKGALLAEKLGARLELYVCETKASKEARVMAHVRKSSEKPFLLDLKERLEELASPLRKRGLDVATQTQCADPLHLALSERTKRTTADLVIKDTHHHSLAKRTFLTNTDWHLIRTCPVPLLLTKRAAWAPTPRILAAVDPGHANDKPAVLDYRILDYASLLAQRLGGELHALHAYVPLAVATAAALDDSPTTITFSAEDLAFEEQRNRKRLRELVSEYAVSDTNLHVEIGGPVEVLPRAAGAVHADIVAMGVISRSGVQRAFIGSTAEDVLEQLPCDALIVKPPDFTEMLPF
jgi:universal stress protein E